MSLQVLYRILGPPLTVERPGPPHPPSKPADERRVLSSYSLRHGGPAH
jgi:hypothetical protein